MDVVILVVLLMALGVLVFIAFRLIKDAPDRNELFRLRIVDQNFNEASIKLQNKDKEITQLQIDNTRLNACLEHEQKTALEKMKLLQDSEARLKTEFENLANRIFQEKGSALNEQNRERISGLLQPFKEQLASFRQRVDEVHKDDTERSAKFLEQVRQLQELSNKVSDEANNLARAIKGDAKKQGDWGEMIVGRIFEASGLERGREYECQVAIRADDGSLNRPDFIVHLPENKAVIVDSKVSLTAYERFCTFDEDADKASALSEHLDSVRKHVQELRAKDYSRLLGNRTLDFVIMCIPLEPAYQAALQSDADLVYDLAKTNVVVTGPATLMITLKLISQIWRREHENQNAEEIARQAGGLYDQVALIVDALTDARKKLEGVSNSFDMAMKRLKDGRGSLVGRVQGIRRLGAKVSKQIPEAILAEAAVDDENDAGESIQPPIKRLGAPDAATATNDRE